MPRILPRENPFRSERIDNISYHLQVMTWDDIMLKLEKFNYRASIVGPKGSGKTTFVKNLVQRLKHKGFSLHFKRLIAEKRSISLTFWLQFVTRANSNTILLIDGMDQLGLLHTLFLRAFSLHLAGLIVTCHQSTFLPCLMECSTHVDLMDEIISELVGENNWKAIDIGRHYFHKHGGNIREALRELYDLSASGHL